jgi:hypothetical protein
MVLTLAGSAAHAGAGLEPGSTCSASGTFRDAGVTVDAATSSGVVTVHHTDTVDWTGSVTGAPGPYSGSVWVKLPPPFGTVTIRSWSGDSQTTSNSGTEHYNLPSMVPAGITFTVAGEHKDNNGRCAGSVQLQFDGSPLGSPITWVSLGGTAITGIGAAFALRPLFRKVM